MVEKTVFLLSCPRGPYTETAMQCSRCNLIDQQMTLMQWFSINFRMKMFLVNHDFSEKTFVRRFHAQNCAYACSVCMRPIVSVIEFSCHCCIFFSHYVGSPLTELVCYFALLVYFIKPFLNPSVTEVQ